MIQRIQSVYLIIVAIAGALTYFLPVVSMVPGAEATDHVLYHLTALQVFRMDSGETEILMRPWPVVILGVFSIVLALFTLFQFNRRALQIRLTHLLMLLILAQIALIVYSAENLKGMVGSGHMISFNVWSALPLIQVIFTRLATAAIKRDEALVRSADRLR